MSIADAVSDPTADQVRQILARHPQHTAPGPLALRRRRALQHSRRSSTRTPAAGVSAGSGRAAHADLEDVGAAARDRCIAHARHSLRCSRGCRQPASKRRFPGQSSHFATAGATASVLRAAEHRDVAVGIGKIAVRYIHRPFFQPVNRCLSGPPRASPLPSGRGLAARGSPRK